MRPTTLVAEEVLNTGLRDRKRRPVAADYVRKHLALSIRKPVLRLDSHRNCGIVTQAIFNDVILCGISPLTPLPKEIGIQQEFAPEQQTLGR